MPGHNHYRDCTCGWCLKYGYGRRAAPIYTSTPLSNPFSTFRCFTIPNATCPVCGASVFFYQSPTGGRVFFDELGPPWPKHPCTDNPSLPVGRLSETTTAHKSKPAWQKAGWEPITIRSSRTDGTWHAIPCVNLATNIYFDALADAALRVNGETCALMRPWDSNGWSVISYVDLDGAAHEIVMPVFERKRHINTPRWVAVGQRKKVEAG
jgi:hypothetical protein